MTDLDGYTYGIAANYDTLSSIAPAKQKPLFSNNNTDYFSIKNHMKLIDDAINSIKIYGTSSSTYKKYEKRILKDALCVIYVLLECFNETCTYMDKQGFIDFCKQNRLEKYSEGYDMSVLAERWNVNY